MHGVSIVAGVYFWGDKGVLEATTIAESSRDQEEGGELDSYEEVKRFCGSRRDQDEGGGTGPSS